MQDETEDILLIKLISEGDRLAFKHLFYKYVDAMVRFVSSYTKEREAAQDIVSEIFAYIWERRNTINIHDNVKSYLFVSARNRTITWLNNRKSVVSIDDEKIQNSLVYEDSMMIESEELSGFIWEAVSMLPGKCREIFIKSRKEEMTNKEIAVSMNISEKTVENQITIAIKKLRAGLEKIYSIKNDI